MTKEIDFETHLIKAIQEERKFQASFSDLVDKFEEKISSFDFENNSILINVSST
jgi:CRISPR/Cas system-associated protein Csm6